MSNFAIVTVRSDSKYIPRKNIKEFCGKSFDYFCCLYPTAPFVNAKRIRDGYDAMVAQNAAGAMPVVQYSYPIQRALRISDGAISMREPEHLRSRSQDLEPMYHDAGQYYWYRTSDFLKNPNIMTSNPVAIVTPEEEVQDIDTLDDWKMAEMKFSLLRPPQGPQ